MIKICNIFRLVLKSRKPICALTAAASSARRLPWATTWSTCTTSTAARSVTSPSGVTQSTGDIISQFTQTPGIVTSAQPSSAKRQNSRQGFLKVIVAMFKFWHQSINTFVAMFSFDISQLIPSSQCLVLISVNELQDLASEIKGNL